MTARLEPRVSQFESRVTWRSLPPAETQETAGEKRQNSRLGWVVISTITVLQLGWIGYHYLLRPAWLAGLPAWLAEWLQLAESAGIFTIVILWGGLWWRQKWQQRQAMAAIPEIAAPLTVEGIYALSPGAFEQYVAGIFRRKGHGVRLRGGSGDLGVDLEIINPHGKRAIAQCKRYQNTVGAEVVRELYGTLIHERAAHAFLVTTADISDAARAWAQGKPITLIDGQTLLQIARQLIPRSE
ncbi:MAG: hypothetical protein Fur0021_22440 [Candidatus Promineifilaceae bacterium]